MRHGLLIALLCASSFSEPRLEATPTTNISPNGLGTSVSSPASGIYNIQGGTTAGGNLFHSFSSFNLGAGDKVDFNVASGVTNILARVTGGASTIGGTITSTNIETGQLSSANLFLINPAGVMFTNTAQINLGGSFAVSTADFVTLSDGAVFDCDASLSAPDAGLTSAPISAFGFLSATPQPVSFAGTQIAMRTGAGLHVVAGNITVQEGAVLSAPSGNVSLFSAASAGQVPFSLGSPGSGYANATTASLGAITVQSQSKVAIDGAGGGSVVIRGGSLVVNNATINSANSGSVTGGNIAVNLSGALSVSDGGSIAANALSSGNGGKVSVQAAAVSIDGSAVPAAFTGIASDSETGATGNSGGASIDAGSGPVSIVGGGRIVADTASSGNAGEVDLSADSLTIDGSAAVGSFTGISSSCNAGSTAGAQGGLVALTLASAVSITGGGAISATTFTAGNAGEINLQAGALTINGAIDGSNASAGFTGIASDCEAGSSGNGGDISANIAGKLSILNGGLVAANTASSGQAGNIAVTQADAVDIDGSGAIGHFTGISSVANLGATGNGGNIDLTCTHEVSIVGTGVIEADTFASGSAGNIHVQAESMTIDGSVDPNGLTGIASNADAGASGVGGDVVVHLTSDLLCTGGGGIGSQAFSSGHGGEVNVTAQGSAHFTDGGYLAADTYAAGNGGTLVFSAQAIYIDGSGPAGVGEITGISSDSNAEYNPNAVGNGGNVGITAQSLSMVNGGKIAALTETRGNGGNVTINVAGNLSLASGSQITAASASTSPLAGQAGTVIIDAGDVDIMDASSIATSSAASNAGSIDLTSNEDLMLENGGSISTSAAIDGGSITLKVGQLVYLLDSEITSQADGGRTTNGGNILIDPDFVVLDNGVISANDLLGTGGNIMVLSNYMFNPDNSMTATGATDGVVSTPPPDLQLGESLVAQRAELVSAASQLRERCARALNHEFSSLIMVGRGGTESGPNELQPDFGVDDGTAGASPK